jgi:hypothetical protein
MGDCVQCMSLNCTKNRFENLLVDEGWTRNVLVDLEKNSQGIGFDDHKHHEFAFISSQTMGTAFTIRLPPEPSPPTNWLDRGQERTWQEPVPGWTGRYSNFLTFGGANGKCIHRKATVRGDGKLLSRVETDWRLRSCDAGFPTFQASVTSRGYRKGVTSDGTAYAPLR